MNAGFNNRILIGRMTVSLVWISSFLLPSSMVPIAWVYILTNKNNTTLYVGVTNDLSTRLWEHKTKQNPKCFTARYNLTKLILYEGFESIGDAIKREKYIKGKTRKWKDELIKSTNFEMKDLSSMIVY